MSDRKTMHVVSTKENLRSDNQLMSTCRLGDKWYRRLSLGGQFDICVCEPGEGSHEMVGVGQVVDVKRCEFRHLTLSDWVTNHLKTDGTPLEKLADAMETADGDDVSLNSYGIPLDKLADAMVDAYGDDFSLDAIVTIIYYLRVA